MLIGVAIVITVYLLMNVSFFAVLSYDQIRSAEAVALVRRDSYTTTYLWLLFTQYCKMDIVRKLSSGYGHLTH